MLGDVKVLNNVEMDCKGENFYIRFLAATNKKTASLSGNYLQMIAEKQKFNKVIGGYIRNTYRYQLFLELIVGLILLEMVGASRHVAKAVTEVQCGCAVI